MIKDRKFRIALTKRSHYWFFHFYFRHYVTFRTADFHREMFHITEDKDITTAVIVAFRGSGKSTIFTLSYALWSILGKQQKKFAVILSQTQRQARQHLINVKTELEKNIVLSRDLGPFREERDDWGGYSLVISNHNARISAASNEQSIRGIRHLQSRPDVIIADDVEDLQSVRTQEGRNKTYNWFKGDVIPAGETNTKMIIVGNLLHEDSLLRRLQQEIKESKLSGIYREFPLIDANNKPLWPDKFPTEKEIKKEKKKVGNEIAWQREYMLTIIPESDRIIQNEWIKYYDVLPEEKLDFEFRYAATGIDPAISEKETADYTAMVSAKVFGYGENMQIYILPYPVNKRLSFLKSTKRAEEISERLGNGRKTKLFVEDVGYQKAFIETLKREHYPAMGVPNLGRDKRARLITVSPALENGMVFFPMKGAETLISQLFGFGVEKHDDLVDAFSILIGEILKDKRQRARLFRPEIKPENKPITADLYNMRF